MNYPHRPINLQSKKSHEDSNELRASTRFFGGLNLIVLA